MAASESTPGKLYKIDKNMLIKSGQNQYTYYAKLFDSRLKEVGEFSINKKEEKTDTMDMGIHIDDEFKGKRLSRCLIYVACEYAKQFINKEQELFIDTDASWEKNSQGELVSFWDRIGMKENPLYDETEDGEGVGYEKVITFGELEEFGIPCASRLTEARATKYPSLKGGKKRKKRKKATKKLRKSKSKSKTKKSKRSKSKKSKRRM